MEHRKKIWFAVINDLSYDQRMYRICSALQDSGSNVTLVGRMLVDSKPLIDQPFEQKRIKCFFKKGALMYAEFNLRLFFLFLQNGIDVHGACDLDTLLALRLSGLLRRRPVVFDAHEYFTEVPEVMHRPFVKSVWKWIGRTQIPKTKFRYTVNELLAKELEKLYGVRFEVVKNVPESGINTEPNIHRSFKEDGGGRNIIIYQGALNEGRGIESAVEAMQYLPTCVLWLVGEGDLSEKLRHFVEEKNLGEKVVFWGKVDPDELRSLTQQAKVGINLLDGESKNYYFSLANKFFDYLHADIPSVNMNFPVYRKILDEYPVGICIDHLEPTALAKKIDQLIHADHQLVYIPAHFERAKKEFNWEKEKLHLLKLWATVLN